jgi:hypothetical protein
LKLTRKIKKVQEELLKKVQSEYRHDVEISVREEPGPLGLKVIVAYNPKAHPGTGMKKVLMDDDGITYGIHGEKEFAELVRAQGWCDAPPEPTAFLKLVNLAYYDGIGKFSDTEFKLEKTSKDLVFHFVKIEHPSGKRIPVVMTIGASGPAVFTPPILTIPH